MRPAYPHFCYRRANFNRRLVGRYFIVADHFRVIAVSRAPHDEAAPAADGATLEKSARDVATRRDVLGRLAELDVLDVNRFGDDVVGVSVAELTGAVVAVAPHIAGLVEKAGEVIGKCDLPDRSAGPDVAHFVRMLVIADRSQLRWMT